MKKSLLFAFALFTLLPGWAQRPIDGLAHRILGDRDSCFRFVYQSDTIDFFELKQQGQHIVVTGNNDNSLAMGLNHYLKHYAHAHVSWFACEPIELPTHFPVVDQPVRREALVRDRFFLNYCTYGYTMPWWQWEQWERFIDWMALNGITLPLAITGQEAIWYEVWKDMGMTDEEIRSYFSGPAHLPWHRMANLDSFGGPLPHSWLEHQKALQKRIVARERELNMAPVLPAFAGHVPKRFAEMHPEADIQQLSAWCGFEPTYFLNSSDSLFTDIQKRFMQQMVAQFGTDHIYGVDPFNEMDPPSWEPDYLATVSQNIYQSMASVDADARWLQMTWVFYYKRKSWTPERLRAYLTAVPQDKLVLLDYFCENTEVWRTTDGFYNQPYIWCYLGNFGGNTMLVGNINELEARLSATLHDAGRNLSGIGSTLESFDVSPHIYEYLFERAWTRNADLAAWTDNWSKVRTGRQGMEPTWRLLVDSIYHDWSFYGLGTQLVARPSLEGHGTYYTKPKYNYSNDTLLSICRQLLNAYPAAAAVAGYEGRRKASYDYDIVNFLSQWLGNHFMDIRDDFTRAYHHRDLPEMRRHVKRANRLFRDVEQLLNTHPAFMLGPWIVDARAMGSTPDEQDYYEREARTLLTIWGGPILNDYANRMWGGLVQDYYAKRWNRFFQAVIDSVKAGSTFNEKQFGETLSQFENAWTMQHGQFPTHAQGSSWQTAKKILKHYPVQPSATEPRQLPASDLQTGDLLFIGTSETESTSGMDKAIVAATGKQNGVSYTHVAIVEIDAQGRQWVIEATPQRGVDRHPLDTLLQEVSQSAAHTVIHVMRLRNNTAAAHYVDNAKHYLGRAYDLLFLPDNEAQYCSELVHNAYVTPKGKPLFHSRPMNFQSPDGTYPTYWVELFQRMGHAIPQGLPGTNPNDMQREKLLHFIGALLP